MVESSTMEFDIGSATDRGKKRILTENQDSMIVLSDFMGRGLPPVMIIADGMGGYFGGEVASQILIDSFRDAYHLQRSAFSFTEFCTAGLEKTHKKLVSRANADIQYEGMGTTVVIGCVQQDKLHIMNIGDSRAYQLQNGKLVQVSYDHTVVGEAVRAGLIKAKEAINHPNKNQLTQSVSTRNIKVTPYYCSSNFGPGDTLLLCSDGLWGVVEEAKIKKAISSHDSQTAADRLVSLANTAGGPDNITVIVCRKTE